MRISGGVLSNLFEMLNMYFLITLLDYMGLIYAGLMNVARSTTYGELERFIRHQRERDWQPSKRDIKTLYTELEKWLIAVKTRRIRTEFHLLSDKFTSSELDELMAKLAYDFLRHLVAENMLIAAQRESERRGRRK